ncbi:unnamed protein product, partial [Allacma fusca]
NIFTWNLFCQQQVSAYPLGSIQDPNDIGLQTGIQQFPRAEPQTATTDG